MNNRQVDLLNRLIQETEPVTGKLLAQQYLVSTKTIYNDISVINQYLKAFSSVIKKKPSMGIYIEIDEKYINIEQIHLNSIENGIIRIFFYFDNDY